MIDQTIKKYISEVQALRDRGIATEPSYRTPFQNFISECLRIKRLSIKVIQEQKREEFGAPDFRIERSDLDLVGYIETKDVEKDLSDVLKGKLKDDKERLNRYLEAVPNLILTNYLDFVLFRDGKKVLTASLEESGGLEKLLEDFFLYEYPVATKPSELASYLAKKCKTLKGILVERLLREERANKDIVLTPFYNAFRDYLMPSLEKEHFADAYAQTITYGLFLARLHSQGPFTRRAAREGIPKSIPLLRSIFDHIAGDLPPDVEWIIDELVGVLSKAALEAILAEFRFGEIEHDPFIHFYEDFLKVYNPKEKERRGVFYTPEPVVSFITRSVDKLLKSHFEKEGLEDEGVVVLDPAAGTGTFLAYCIELIKENLKKKGEEGTFNQIVEKHILKNLYGFEILVSPYAICHLKLSKVLEDLGYNLSPIDRLKVYLTNTLELKEQGVLELPFIKDLTMESHEANEVKGKKPVLVVLGNPPYSVSSNNKSDFIMKRLEDYKKEVKGERNIQPLDDDYIKFLRFAQWKIAEQNGEGIVAMITNNSYLSGLIHRGMRRHLLETFDEMYILNLHGNSLIGETAPDGSKDENVFDIRVGTAIAIFVNRKGRSLDQSRERPVKLAQVYYYDLYGLRERKHDFLWSKDIRTVKWKRLPQRGPYFFFVPKDFAGDGKYSRFWSMDKIFIKSSEGVKTHRDHFIVDFEKEVLQEKLNNFRTSRLADNDLAKEYGLSNTVDFNISTVREAFKKVETKHFKEYFYRPFDIRWIYYDSMFVDRAREEIMRHFIVGENLGLALIRRIREPIFRHVYVTNKVTDKTITSSRDNAHVFPLYLYTEFNGKHLKEPNLRPEFLKETKSLYGKVSPEEILYYIYAILHSPLYRQRYQEFLKIDFPRIPLFEDKLLFKRLARVGERLVKLHLLEDFKKGYQPGYPVGGGHIVEKVAYDEVNGRVYINETQYFGKIPPEVWDSHVGGYQVLQKWLKDRKDRALSLEEIKTYRQIVAALRETIETMSRPPLANLPLDH